MRIGIPPAKSTKDLTGINRSLGAYTNLMQAMGFCPIFVRNIKRETNRSQLQGALFIRRYGGGKWEIISYAGHVKTTKLLEGLNLLICKSKNHYSVTAFKKRASRVVHSKVFF